MLDVGLDSDEQRRGDVNRYNVHVPLYYSSLFTFFSSFLLKLLNWHLFLAPSTVVLLTLLFPSQVLYALGDPPSELSLADLKRWWDSDEAIYEVGFQSSCRLRIIVTLDCPPKAFVFLLLNNLGR